MKTCFLSTLGAVLRIARFGRPLLDRPPWALAIVLLGAGLNAPIARAAAYTTIDWLDLSSVGLNSSAAGGTFILPGYPGSVTVSFTSTSPDWTRYSYPPAENGIVTSPAGAYGWTSVDYLAAVDITGLIDYTLTFSFSGPPLPAGQLVLASIGLGGHLADGPTTATVYQNGTFLGDWKLGAGFGPTVFTPGAGMFSLTNLLVDPVPGYFNTDFGVTRIEDSVAGSLTISVHQVGGDGIGFTLGLIANHTCTNDCITLYNPADLVVATCSNSAPVFYTATASDACCSNCVTLVSDPPSGTSFAVGTTTVSSTATDTMGNSNSCTFTVTVTQNTNPPVITFCPAVVLVCTNNSNCVPMPDATSQVQATSSGGGTVQISQDISPGTILCSNTVVTFTVTDDCGNSTNRTVPCYLTNCTGCLQMQCPSNIVVLACSNVPVFYQPTVTDSCCSNWTVVCTPPSGSVFVLGTTTNVHCVATDCNSNTTSCDFTVTVAQSTATGPLQLLCPSNITVLTCSNSALVAYPNPQILGNCDGSAVLTCAPPAPGPFAIGTNEVDCSVTNAAGDSNWCSFTITVLPSTAPPIITCPTNKTVSCGSYWSFNTPTALDGAGGNNVTITVLGTYTNGSPCNMSVMRVWQVTDACGNSATCSNTVTVVDATPPVLFWPLTPGPNLVPNPGFEIHTNCPYNEAQINFAAPWFQPAYGTPDYFNACGTWGGVFFGTQTPHGGQAYAGAYAWISSFYRYGEYREYIETPLQSPLVAGTYEVSFWVSLADNCLYAVDNLGAHLSVGPITSTHKRALPFPPQVRNAAGRFLTSTNGWMLIQGTFTTSGGENYLTIGNLYDDLNTPILVAGGNLFLLSYYFIDDVTVRQIGTSCPTNKTVYSQTNVTFDTPTAYDACCGTNVTLTWSTVTNGTDITRTWVATDCCTNTNSCSQTITINTNISIIHAGWATDNGHNLIIDWTNISPYNWRMQHSPDLVHWLDATNALPPIVITNVLNVGVPMQFYRLVRTN